MANKFTRFLTGVGDGLLTPKGQLANWQHATKLFVSDTMRLAPRTKFMFYVRFEIDKTVLKAPQFTNKYADEVGYLVKSADLPKFTMESVTKNQYNRKHIIYKNFTYDPINLTFHDDSQGIINALWALYFGYYSADRNLPSQAFSKSISTYRSTNTGFDNFRYGLDNNKSVDIFKSISIYTMSRRRFNGYTLVNPKITSWSHGQVAYDANDFLENTMSINYESVIYSSGQVKQNSPAGFAMLHYDNTPSPLSVAGGGVANLFGQGGVLDGMESIFGSVSDGSAFGSVGGFLGTAISAVNTVKNLNNLSKEGLKNEAINIISSPATIAGLVGGVGGIIGSVFPKNTQSGDTTPATQKKVVNDDNINGFA
jgi:hypothetical protein